MTVELTHIVCKDSLLGRASHFAYKDDANDNFWRTACGTIIWPAYAAKYGTVKEIGDSDEQPTCKKCLACRSV